MPLLREELKKSEVASSMGVLPGTIQKMRSKIRRRLSATELRAQFLDVKGFSTRRCLLLTLSEDLKRRNVRGSVENC
jgi:hypothetical protein